MMPVRRRVAKRRVDEEALFEAWSDYFEFGRPGFAGELEELVGGDPAPEAKAAWQQFGARFLESRTLDARDPWAVRTFGPPKGAR
jgi:hypothetical protein